MSALSRADHERAAATLIVCTMPVRSTSLFCYPRGSFGRAAFMQKGAFTRAKTSASMIGGQISLPIPPSDAADSTGFGAIVVMDAGIGFSRQDAMEATHEGCLVKLYQCPRMQNHSR